MPGDCLFHSLYTVYLSWSVSVHGKAHLAANGLRPLQERGQATGAAAVIAARMPSESKNKRLVSYGIAMPEAFAGSGMADNSC